MFNFNDRRNRAARDLLNVVVPFSTRSFGRSHLIHAEILELGACVRACVPAADEMSATQFSSHPEYVYGKQQGWRRLHIRLSRNRVNV